MIKINNLLNVERSSSLFLWLLLPYLTVSVLVFKLPNITDSKKLFILLFLLFSYLTIFLILFLIKTFRKGVKKEIFSEKDKEKKAEPEKNKSDIKEKEVKKWRDLLSESLKRETEKEEKIIYLEKEISKLEAQTSHLKNKNE